MTPPYMPFFVGDYLADTAHLSAIEHGGYLMLIMNYWQRGGPLPADDRKLARIARMTDDEWRDARENIAEFFEDEGGEWRHPRIDREIAIATEKSAKAKASARASVANRAQKALSDSQPDSAAPESVPPANAERTLSERSTIAELSRLGKARELGSTSLRSAEPSAAARPPTDLDLVEAKCRTAAGVENSPSPGLFNVAPILALIDEGFDLDRQIIPVLKAKAAAKKFGRSWAFYVDAIRDSRLPDAPKLRDVPAPAGSPSVFVRSESEEWRAWIAAYAAQGKPAPRAKQTKHGFGWFFPTSRPPACAEAAA